MKRTGIRHRVEHNKEEKIEIKKERTYRPLSQSRSYFDYYSLLDDTLSIYTHWPLSFITSLILYGTPNVAVNDSFLRCSTLVSGHRNSCLLINLLRSRT